MRTPLPLSGRRDVGEQLWDGGLSHGCGCLAGPRSPAQDTAPVRTGALRSYPGGNPSHYQTFRQEPPGPKQGVSRVYYRKSLVFCQAPPVQSHSGGAGPPKGRDDGMTQRRDSHHTPGASASARPACALPLTPVSSASRQDQDSGAQRAPGKQRCHVGGALPRARPIRPRRCREAPDATGEQLELAALASRGRRSKEVQGATQS